MSEQATFMLLLLILSWAAFGFKNNAERDAVALLKKFKERQTWR